MPEDEVEVADVPADAEPQGPVVPSHEPFSVKLLTMVQTMQSQNGLRHNDHLRYRQYCSRRLRRLYVTLNFKHGRGRFKQVPFPEDFTDVRFLEVLVVQAERAWSYAVQLKADNAAASTVNPRWRHHSIQRFSKAVQISRKLESVSKVHGDQRTQLEAEAYHLFMAGAWLLEKERWEEASNKLLHCRRVVEHLGLASDQAESQLYKAKVQEMAPMIRECRYNLGKGYDAEDDDQNVAISKSSDGRKDLSELSYRGHGLDMPSDKIKGKLMKCVQLVAETKVNDEEESAAVIEKYGGLSVEFGGTLKDIHADMIAAGTEGQTVQWRMLEAFARELGVCMNVERNLVLLWKSLGKLDGLQEVSSPEARRSFRPVEGMRFSDLLKEEVEGLRELPETNDSISRTLTAYMAIVVNCRCLFLAMCHCAMGKLLEAAALMDMLHSRVEDVEMGEELPEPLTRLHHLFERVQRGMPSRVGQWRCRVLAQLCTEATKAKGAEKEKEAAPASQQQAGALEELTSIAAFPPRFRDIPCKPLLFDLAYQCLEQPDLDDFFPKNRASDGGQKGPSIIGRVAGLGSRLGGLFGGRK